jgi:hypothetical protein
VGPRADLDAVKKRKVFPLPGIEPGRPIPQPVVIPTEHERFICKYHVFIWKSKLVYNDQA